MFHSYINVVSYPIISLSRILFLEEIIYFKILKNILVQENENQDSSTWDFTSDFTKQMSKFNLRHYILPKRFYLES